MVNFNLRFFYEFFFEICLCVLIHATTVYEDDFYMYYIATLIFFAIIVFIVFICGLFCKGGPYQVPNIYASKSLGTSWWGVRPLCSEDHFNDQMAKK